MVEWVSSNSTFYFCTRIKCPLVFHFWFPSSPALGFATSSCTCWLSWGECYLYMELQSTTWLELANKKALTQLDRSNYEFDFYHLALSRRVHRRAKAKGPNDWHFFTGTLTQKVKVIQVATSGLFHSRNKHITTCTFMSKCNLLLMGYNWRPNHQVMCVYVCVSLFSLLVTVVNTVTREEKSENKKEKREKRTDLGVSKGRRRRQLLLKCTSWVSMERTSATISHSHSPHSRLGVC